MIRPSPTTAATARPKDRVARGRTRPRFLGRRGLWTRRRGLTSGLLAAVMMLVVASPVHASPLASHPLTSDIQSIGAGGGSAVWWQSCKFIDGVRLRHSLLVGWHPTSLTHCQELGAGYVSRPAVLGARVVWSQAAGGTSTLDSGIAVKLGTHPRRTIFATEVQCGGPIGSCGCTNDGDSAGTVIGADGFAASDKQAVYTAWDIVVPSCDPIEGLGLGAVAGGGVWRVAGRPMHRIAVPGVPPAGLLALGGGRIALTPTAAGQEYPGTVDTQGPIQLRDATAGTLLRTITLSATPIALALRANALAVLADGGSARVILIYDPSTGQRRRRIVFSHKRPSALALNDRELVSAIGRRVMTITLTTGVQHLVGTSPRGHPVSGVTVTDRRAIWFYNAVTNGHFIGVIRSKRLPS